LDPDKQENDGKITDQQRKLADESENHKPRFIPRGERTSMAAAKIATGNAVSIHEIIL
jgi:hypothetical protein